MPEKKEKQPEPKYPPDVMKYAKDAGVSPAKVTRIERLGRTVRVWYKGGSKPFVAVKQ